LRSAGRVGLVRVDWPGDPPAMETLPRPVQPADGGPFRVKDRQGRPDRDRPTARDREELQRLGTLWQRCAVYLTMPGIVSSCRLLSREFLGRTTVGPPYRRPPKAVAPPRKRLAGDGTSARGSAACVNLSQHGNATPGTVPGALPQDDDKRKQPASLERYLGGGEQLAAGTAVAVDLRTRAVIAGNVPVAVRLDPGEARAGSPALRSCSAGR